LVVASELRSIVETMYVSAELRTLDVLREMRSAAAANENRKNYNPVKTRLKAQPRRRAC
jgi:hypothetical protein